MGREGVTASVLDRMNSARAGEGGKGCGEREALEMGVAKVYMPERAGRTFTQ
jgi:hypothetical protein